MNRSPDQAIKNGEKLYSLTYTDGDTEITAQYPIFITRKQNGSLKVVAPYLYKYFEMTEKVVYLQNSALSSNIPYIYQNGVYRPVSNNDISKIMLETIEKFQPKLQSTRPVDEAIRLLERKSDTITHDRMNADEDIINFKNGILNLNTMTLTEHSPDILSTIQIPCNWTDKPCKTPYWDNFIERFTEGNPGCAKLLYEFMGAVISNVYGSRFKKALILVGTGDSGKSRIPKLLAQILGDDASEQNLARLGQRFGETAVYMKRLVFSADMPFMNIENLARFKELTGGDTISIEFKNRDPFMYHYKGLMIFGTNELPKFGGDKGNHVYERMIIMKCNNKIPEKERDSRLEDKLFAEREGIIKKCVIQFRKVLENGYNFSIPPECIATLNEYKLENSAVIEFWNECTEQRAERERVECTVADVYVAFQIWNKEQGYKYTPPKQDFIKEIANYYNIDKNCFIKRYDVGYAFIARKLNSIGIKYLPPP